jgi:hypothetical protein
MTKNSRIKVIKIINISTIAYYKFNQQYLVLLVELILLLKHLMLKKMF